MRRLQGLSAYLEGRVMLPTNRMVSKGYEARPAPMVTPQPRPNEAKNEPSSAPTRTTGSVDVINKGRYKDKNMRNQHTKGIVYTKVETTIDNDTDDRRNKATVQTSDAV
jgi:hypothetical protein